MHPAASVILFTTASGAGYGLLFWLGVFAAMGLAPADRLFGFVALGLATALFTLGLLSSTFHLGRPERAWRALSQWRSSWLSREGVAAIVAYVPLATLAFGWILIARLDGAYAVAGFASAAMAFVTVFCTGMIYATLKPIRQWRNRWTTPTYLTLAGYTGAALQAAVTSIFGYDARWIALLALALLACSAFVKYCYWRSIDAETPRSNLVTATGLTRFESVRLFEAPHTEANYIMREMGFEIARRHSQKLRRLVWLSLFAVPAALLILVLMLGGGAVATVAASLVVLSAGVGVAVERWLFFAEATHASMIYYGKVA